MYQRGAWWSSWKTFFYILVALKARSPTSQPELALNNADSAEYNAVSRVFVPAEALKSMPGLAREKPWRRCRDENGTIHTLFERKGLETGKKIQDPEWIAVNTSVLTPEIKDAASSTALYNFAWLETWAQSEAAKNASSKVEARAVNALQTQTSRTTRAINAVIQKMADVKIERKTLTDVGMLAEADVQNQQDLMQAFRRELPVLPGILEAQVDEQGRVLLRCPEGYGKGR
ncbi:MAG: hypothetical protein Q9159_004798 [Coniocarpon cinnabarinum]